MLVLTWNLFHGRAVPGAGRDLLAAFRERIAGWPWDVALLQEVPPWWPPELAATAGADQRTVLTSRNALLPLRRWAAERWPDVIKSNGGGSNAILVRPSAGTIAEHRARRLRICPERRHVHAVRLTGAGGGAWIANVHAQVRPHSETRQDLAAAGAALWAWAAGAPAVLGGDCNVPDPAIDGFTDLGGHHVDRVLARGFAADGAVTVPERGGLSDHAPVLVPLRRET
ncbi:MAG TPA: endonuclease/exonuclease/phosphatase family protein [Baekduia sp.]|nr:endonuclease/exonuclease/phosphatase family protein [Baekduia sp.]